MLPSDYPILSMRLPAPSAGVGRSADISASPADAERPGQCEWLHGCDKAPVDRYGLCQRHRDKMLDLIAAYEKYNLEEDF